MTDSCLYNVRDHGAEGGDAIYVHGGTNARECECGQCGSPEKFMGSQLFIHIDSYLNGYKTVLCFNREITV
jgi:hypothetical protein